MVVFIKKGDRPLSKRQAIKKGNSLRRNELPKYIEEYFLSLPLTELPNEAQHFLQKMNVSSYEEYAKMWRNDNEINEKNNIFNHELFHYSNSVERINQYKLEEGQNGITEYEDETGNIQQNIHTSQESFDEAVNNGEEIIKTYIPPFEPLTIEEPVYDPDTGEQTGTQLVTHPKIVKDNNERQEAQRIIDNTSQEVIDFYNNQENI